MYKVGSGAERVRQRKEEWIGREVGASLACGKPARRPVWQKKSEHFLSLTSPIYYLLCFGCFSKYFANINSFHSHNNPTKQRYDEPPFTDEDL